MPATLRTPLAAVVPALALALGATACTGDPEPAAESPSTPVATALDDLALDGLALTRRDPCERVDAEVLAEVAGDDASVTTWAPGETLPQSREVADEFGCRVDGDDVTASAWVFAPPVSRREARRLVGDSTGGKCRRTGAATFGSPGVALACDLNRGQRLSGMRGLAGDAWVACEVLGTAKDAERWCTAVLESLSD